MASSYLCASEIILSLPDYATDIQINDTVRCISPYRSSDGPGLQLGSHYTVSSIKDGIITVMGLASRWDASRFQFVDRPKREPAATESDPTGRSLNEPGAKADAGKLRPSLIFRDMADALLVVIKIGTDGANKYSDGGWLEVPNADERYEDADLRHMLKRFAGQATDTDSGSTHLGHEAWNALAKLQLFLNKNPQYKVAL